MRSRERTGGRGSATKMQKEFVLISQSVLWDSMWTSRSIEKELEACAIHSPLRELLLSFLPPKGKILEAGCGLGRWVIYLKQKGYDIVGIDNNELAVAKLRDFDETLQVELGDILHIDYPDSSFDAYISLGVVEHLEDGPTSALREAYRVLRPNGLIFVSVPTVNVIRKLVRRPLRNAINAFPRGFGILVPGGTESRRDALRAAIATLVGVLPQRIARPLLRIRGRYYHFSEYRYSRSELENFLKQSNFEVIETVPDDFYGSKDHAPGLVVDFPFLGARNGDDFELNRAGRLISRILDTLSPWIACSAVLCIGRSLKAADCEASQKRHDAL